MSETIYGQPSAFQSYQIWPEIGGALAGSDSCGGFYLSFSLGGSAVKISNQANVTNYQINLTSVEKMRIQIPPLCAPLVAIIFDKNPNPKIGQAGTITWLSDVRSSTNLSFYSVNDTVELPVDYKNFTIWRFDNAAAAAAGAASFPGGWVYNQSSARLILFMTAKGQ